MKVIVAGFPKTGTKSMVVALQELGYNVHDFLEQHMYNGKEWEKIFAKGGTTEDFRRMYENVDAVTDVPGAYFWDEIHSAFPDAKIVLTVREDEDAWYRSMLRQMRVAQKPVFRILPFLSPTGFRLHVYGNRIGNAIFGLSTPDISFIPAKINETVMRMGYRRHNAHVLQNAPEDKLLVYSVKEGWEPLCKFLNKPVPSKPFPHRNVRGSILEDFLKEHPLFIRMKREAMITSCLLTVLLLYSGYKLATGRSLCNCVQSWFEAAKHALT